MYCTNCGQKGVGNFCAACGTRVGDAAAVPEVLPAGDWERETCYLTLLRYPAVRDRIAKCPSAVGKPMSGEEWLALFDKAFKPAVGVSLKTVAAVAAPIYAKMRVKTGKARIQVLAAPPGRVIVDVLCALARNGLTLGDVHQGATGCVFEAKLPSDLWAYLEGQLVVSVHRVGNGTMVEAATTIPGQLFDWGKSSRCLNRLFQELTSQAA